MGDLLFKIPESICSLLNIEECDDYVKQYIVSGEGSLFVPWSYLFETINEEDPRPINVSIIDEDGVLFLDVDDMIERISEEEQHDLSAMVKILVTYHNAKMDKTNITIVA